MAGAAHETFMSMLRDLVGPALRAEGLTGAGKEYAIPSDSHWATVGFQAGWFGTAEHMTFTINCKVVRKDVWAEMFDSRPYIGRRPKPNVHDTFGWDRRIGQLLPSGSDTWWSVEAGADVAAIADDVIEKVIAYGLPAMRAEITGPR